MLVFPQNSHVEALSPSVIALGGGAFGRKLGVDEVVRLGFPWGFMFL